jgi:hypothetical protein
MYSVKVNRKKLIKTIEANRAKHAADYEEAITSYRSASNAAFNDALDARYKLEDWSKLSNVLTINLPVPINMTSQYDDVLEMLKLSVESAVELDQTQFKNYVQDDWAKAAKLTASFYKGSNV